MDKHALIGISACLIAAQAAAVSSLGHYDGRIGIDLTEDGRACFHLKDGSRIFYIGVTTNELVWRKAFEGGMVSNHTDNCIAASKPFEANIPYFVRIASDTGWHLANFCIRKTERSVFVSSVSGKRHADGSPDISCSDEPLEIQQAETRKREAGWWYKMLVVQNTEFLRPVNEAVRQLIRIPFKAA